MRFSDHAPALGGLRRSVCADRAAGWGCIGVMAALDVKSGRWSVDSLDAPWSGVVRSVAHGRLRRMVGHAYEAPLGDDNV